MSHFDKIFSTADCRTENAAPSPSVSGIVTPTTRVGRIMGAGMLLGTGFLVPLCRFWSPSAFLKLARAKET